MMTRNDSPLPDTNGWLQILWRRHYNPPTGCCGTTGSYSGDMALAYSQMLADPECTDKERRLMMTSIRAHLAVEANEVYRRCHPDERRWFTEQFPTPA